LIFISPILVLVNGTRVPDAKCMKQGRKQVNGKRPDIQV
jgi:hypothetical protein